MAGELQCFDIEINDITVNLNEDRSAQPGRVVPVGAGGPDQG